MLGNETGNGLDLEPELEPGKETEKPHSVLHKATTCTSVEAEDFCGPLLKLRCAYDFELKSKYHEILISSKGTLCSLIDSHKRIYSTVHISYSVARVRVTQQKTLG